MPRSHTHHRQTRDTRGRWRRWRLAPAVALLLTSCDQRPPPEVPVPPNHAQLDPQLRSHLDRQITAVRAHPRDAAAHAHLGLSYAVNDLWTWAQPAFSNAAVLAPDDPLPAMYAGVAVAESGDYAAARIAFEKLTQRHPGFGPGWYRLAEINLRLGLLDDARRAFQRLVETAPGEWRGHAGLGDVALRGGDPKGAVKHLEAALRLDPEARTAHSLLAAAERALGRTNEAAWHTALGRNAIGSPMPDAWTPLASGHMKLLSDQFALADQLAAEGQPQRAVELLRETLQFHPDNSEVINRLAIACNRAGRLAEARGLLTPLLDKNPTNTAPWLTLSFTEALAGRHLEALAAADRAVALGTNLAQPHLARANALLGMERDEDAIRAFQDAARADPTDAEIQLELGDVTWRNLERPAEARAYFRRARELNPALPGTYVRLAELETELGNPQEAAAAVATLRQLRPGSAELRAAEQHLRAAPK